MDPGLPVGTGETAGLLAFVGLGLVGSVHCLGMCGPLVTTYADRLDDGGPVSTHEIRQQALSTSAAR
nr:sulfite exporter TauE/SafE family protein [Halomicroarcula sp. SYNS111]